MTDEVFVLLSGDAVLVISEAGVWHHILMKPGSRVLIAENSDTSPANTEYAERKS